MKHALSAAALAAGSTLLLGCNSTGVGNPKIDSIELSVRMDDQPELAPDVSAGGAPATEDDDLPEASIHHAILVLAALRWLPCDETLEPSVALGPFVLDLKKGQSEPELPAIQTPLGGFCGLDAPLTPAASPAVLAGRSIWFDGERADGTQFLLYADMQATLRVRARGAAVWDGGDTHHVLWAFRPRRWLARSELALLESVPWGGARAIAINVERHPALYAAIRARLAGRSTLYADLNENGIIDAEDRSSRGLVGDGSDRAD